MNWFKKNTTEDPSVPIPEYPEISQQQVEFLKAVQAFQEAYPYAPKATDIFNTSRQTDHPEIISLINSGYVETTWSGHNRRYSLTKKGEGLLTKLRT